MAVSVKAPNVMTVDEQVSWMLTVNATVWLAVSC